MLLALDSYYQGDVCNTSMVVYERYDSKESIYADTIYTRVPAEYVPGQFYKRELPGIEAILDKFRTEHPELWSQVKVIIVDSFVYLADKIKIWDGLGAKLYKHLCAIGCQRKVIGVAKSNFGECDKMPHTTIVYRGTSKRPLYVQAIGLSTDEAPFFNAERWLRRLYGEHRIPKMLQDVDKLSRVFATVAK